jgi:hypothetical protein
MKAGIRFTSFTQRAKWVCNAVASAAVINFLAFVLGSLYLGGDALNGSARAGRYFVCAHGACTEVSKAIWNYSYWHALSACAGIILAFAVIAVFLNTGDIQFE